MVEIIPSILTNSPQELRDLLEQAKSVVERVSVDIIDGKFSNNKTIDPSTLFGVDTGLKLDFQLMVDDPINWVEKCVRAGADRIIGHIKKMSSQLDFVGKVQDAGAYVGLGLDIDVPVSKLDLTILTNLDVVLLMSVPAGFVGQKFDSRVLDKIKKLDKIRARDDTPYRIHVDGGITHENINNVIYKGADEVSIGKRIFKGDLRENIMKLKKKT